MVEKLKEKIKLWWEYRSLRTKLICAAVVLILTPMLMLGTLVNLIVMYISYENSEQAYLQAVRQMTFSLENRVENVQASVLTMQANSRLCYVFRHLIHDPVTPGEEYDYFQEIKPYKESLLNQCEAVRVRIALRAEATYIKPYFDMFPESILLEEEVCQGDSTSLRNTWFAPGTLSDDIIKEQNSMVYCVELVDFLSTNEHQGYILVELNPSKMFEALAQAEIVPGACVVVYHGQDVFYAVGDQQAQEDVWRILEGKDPLSNRHYQIVHSQMDVTGWEVVMLVPHDALAAQGRALRNVIMVMALLLSGVAILFAVYCTNRIDQRLRAIIYAIRHMEEGKFGLCLPVEGHDEYSVVMEAVNEMSVHTRDLMEAQRQLENENRKAEMRVLYEQINPHFIYNTLDVVRWQILSDKSKEVVGLVDALVRYLRLNLNHGKELTTVEGELQEIEEYIAIMNYRYRGSIDYEGKIEGDIRMQPVLKLILQPLVENAILHGVMSRDDKHGYIRVRAWREERMLYYTVEDNGVGMLQKKAEAILADSTDDHYGIRSVHKRLQTYYGPESGLSIRTAPQQGCLVTVTIYLGTSVLFL